MKGILILVLSVVVLLLAIVVGSRNADVVTINYLIAQVDIRISTFMVICLILGFMLGIFTILLKYLSLKLKLVGLKKQLARAEQLDKSS